MTATRVGVLVPCRNEAAVIERRIANLAAEDWPAGAHRVTVVDDGSTDGTADRARRAIEAAPFPAGVAVECVANEGRPGKAGAMRAALERWGTDVDLVVLTDADVVQRRGSLAALVDAFARDERLGLACAAQCFVHELPADGSAPSAAPPGPAAAPWDRWTAVARRAESRRGALWSAHGQLMAWRASLGLSPAADVAADDLDLSLALRRAHPGAAARLIDGALFFEVKPARGARDDQALRRARAWFQAIDRAPRVGGAQAALYRFVPRRAPELAAGGVALVVLTGWLVAGVAGGLVAALAPAVLAATPTGRHVAFLLRTIARARRVERERPLDARWETPR